MGEIQRVEGERLTALSAIVLDALLERPPRVVDEVFRRMRVVVDFLGVEVEHVGARVRERPGDVAIEADDDRGKSRNGYSIEVERAGNDQLRFVPDGRQTELEVWVTGEQRVAGRRAPR